MLHSLAKCFYLAQLNATGAFRCIQLINYIPFRQPFGTSFSKLKSLDLNAMTGEKFTP